MLPPEAAIDPSKDVVSIDTAMAVRVTFVQDSRAARALVRCDGGIANRR